MAQRQSQEIALVPAEGSPKAIASQEIALVVAEAGALTRFSQLILLVAADPAPGQQPNQIQGFAMP
jgi:hypothetical protein